MIVTKMVTVSGPVVQWYTGDDNVPLEEIAFASASTMLYLAETPLDVVKNAQSIHQALADDPDADVSKYVTHTRDGVWFTPIDGPPAEGGE